MRTRFTPSRDTAARLLGAALAGLLLALSFPPFGGPVPLAPVAVALLAVTVHGTSTRTGALAGGIGGFVFFLVLLEWLRVIGVDAWIGLSAVCALFFAVLGASWSRVSRSGWWPLWFAALWVAVEALRDRVPFGGFPWGRLAFTDHGALVPLAAVGGAPLVTFATALVGTLLAWAVLAVRREGLSTGSGGRRRVATALVGAVVVVPVLAAAVPLPTEGRPVQVAVVQGNVPRSGLDFLGQQRAVLGNHVQAATGLADDIAEGRVPRPDLVVWPENSTDIDPFTDRDAYEAIDGAVAAVGAPTLVGAVLGTPDGEQALNTGIVWDPEQGPGERYTKRQLVPFGEYIPFRSQLEGWITRLDRVSRDFRPGTAPGVLQMGSVTVADVICFEVAYDEVVRDAVNGGGEIIVVQTNNATYGRTGQPPQQAVMSRLRAIEHGRPVLTAATSGISQVVAADGTVEQQTDEFVQQVLSAEVLVRTDRTVADRVGAAPEWLLVIVGVASVVLAGVRRRRADDRETEST